MSDNKTQPTEVPVSDFIASVDHPGRRLDAERLDEIFRDVTGWTPRMWGPSIIGDGAYDYTYESGRSGRFLATGFSPRKANMVVYIMPGYSDFGSILDRLGKHKLGKSCLYLGRLAGVDEEVLKELIRAGLDDLSTRWTVTADP